MVFQCNTNIPILASCSKINLGIIFYSILSLLYFLRSSSLHLSIFPVYIPPQFSSVLQLMSIMLVMLSNHLILCRPLLLPPSVFPRIGVFSNESVLLIRWPKYWSFSFSISPSNEYSGFISFRIDWFDCLADRGSLESSPTPQFKTINSLALSFLYSPILTSIHDYWKNHSFD